MANFFSKILNNLFQSDRVVDDDFYEELEEAMIQSDVSYPSAMRIIDAVKREATQKNVNLTKDVQKILKDYLSDLLSVDEDYYRFEQEKSIVSVIGVNGVGKTTSIGKLAYLLKRKGKKVVLAAADTFRSGAIEQLLVWADRVGVDCIHQKEGSDPAAVVFDALQSFKAKNADVLIIDTAGRLHNKKNLMEELGKINRIIDREFAEGYRETLVVLDATTGQNAMSQAKMFKECSQVTGVILSKMDSTAKGGIAISIQAELGLPVKYVGEGEKMEDLHRFDAKKYIDDIFAF
ncbi:MAG: signal recognition particle-docking protein FtsY [Lachnospiraceae bacterium]|nr:signal recognition particle-docking protein FtsY [Lachnospiraceae bacterium]